MPEEPKEWITVNGKHIPLDENGNPITETGKKTLGKGAGQGAETKNNEGSNRRLSYIKYTKRYAQYLEESGGDHKKAVTAFFKEQLQGKSLLCNVDGQEQEVHFTGKSWREIKRDIDKSPLKAEIVPHIQEILENGDCARSLLYKERKDGAIAFYSFSKRIRTSEGRKLAMVDVKEQETNLPKFSVYSATGEGVPGYEKRKKHMEDKKSSDRSPGQIPVHVGENNDSVVNQIIHDAPQSINGGSYFEVVNLRFAGEPINFDLEEDEMARDRPRSDRLAFDVKPSKRHKDGNGYLHVEGSNITKEQIAPYYGSQIPGWEGLGLAPHKMYYLYRPAEELEKAAKGFNGMPLLFEHHETNAANPAKEYVIGSLGTDAEFKAPYVVSSLVITDGQAVDAVERGEYKELSASYYYDPVMTGGVFDGAHYDGYMTNIRPNHVALVKEGRAGPDVAVADQKPQELDIERQETSQGREKESMENNAFKLDLETLTKAVQALLAKCKNPGMDGDPVVQEVADQFFPDAGEEDKKKVMEMLLALKPHKPEALKAEAEPEPQKDQDNEELKKAMADCSVDSDDPEAAKAFAEGMKYARKLAEAHGEEEKGQEEDKIQELAKELEEQKAAMDSQLKTLKAKAIEDTKAHYKALYKAAQDCRPVLGLLADPLTFDSADDIYRKALTAAGVDVKGVHPSAFPAMLKMASGVRGQKQSFAAAAMAADSADRDFLKAAAEGLARIQL